MKRKRAKYFFAIQLIVLVSGWANVAYAQMKLEAGEKIKVFVFTEWVDGVVLGKQGKGWGVQTRFAERDIQDVYHRKQIRKLCEADAIDWARSWASANGTYRVDAALKAFTDTEVTLTKLDLEEIKVKLDSLSAKDIGYVNKLKRSRDAAANRGEVPAIVPLLPELTEIDFDSVEPPSIGIGDAGEVKPLGSMPSFLTTFQQQGVGFPKIRQNADPVAVIPVGGPDQLVLVGTRENPVFSEEFQAQGYWVSLKQKKVVNTIAVSPGAFIVDYDPRSNLLLTVRPEDLFRKGNLPNPQELRGKTTLTVSGEHVLWRLKPGESTVEPLNRWNSKIPFFDNPVAKIINRKIVLTKAGSDIVYAVDVESKQVLYSLKVSGKRHRFDLELTMDRKNLILADEGRVLVVNAETGDLQFSVAVPENEIYAANVSQSGTKLAAISNRSLYIWDLNSTDSQPVAYSAPLIGSPLSGRLFWVDDDNVLISSLFRKVLYRLSLQLPIWSYEMDFRETGIFDDDPMLSCLVNGFLFYLADHNSLFESAMAVGAVKLPGPSVENLAEMATGETAESFYILKPGVHVGISVGSVTDPEQVAQWLEEKIEEAGWVYDQDSEIQIHANMGTLPSRDETYRRFGDFRGDSTTTANVTPHYAMIKIMDGARIVWQTGVTTGAPMFTHTEDLQATIKDAEVPQLEFFSRVKLEPTVIDPEYSHGLGTSKLGLNGIEVVTTSPPGRVDDPLAEAEKIFEERRQSVSEERKAKPSGGSVLPPGSGGR